MNWKRLVQGIVFVFVVQAAVAGALHAGVVDRLIAEPGFARPEGDERLLAYFASRVLFVTLFCYIFVKWFAGRGLLDGLRYALIIWLLYSVPMTAGFWSFFAMPDALAGAWLGIGLAEQVAGGLALGLLYRRRGGTQNERGAALRA